VNTLEDRLRDAYRAAAETVKPETIRLSAVPSPPDRDRRRPRHGRLVIPLAAAAAVIAVAATVAVLLPRTAPGLDGRKSAGGQPPPALLTTPGYLVALNWMVRPYMFVVNATTGIQRARITLPFPAGDLKSVATGDGQTFVVAASEPGLCRTSLYRFSLGADGTPTALTGFATVPGIVQTPWAMAVSGSGQVVAYDALACGQRSMRQLARSGGLGQLARAGYPQQGFVAVVNTETGQTKRWTFETSVNSRTQASGNVSISADGRVVGFGNQVIDADAAPGSLAAHSRVVATGGEFGRSAILGGLNVSPDGAAAYFATFKIANNKPLWGSWQLRAFYLATGQTRLVRSFPGTLGGPAACTFDPTGRYLMAESVVRTGPTTKLALLDIATGHLTQLNASWAVDPKIAW
jgi:hypothetical protein